MIPFLIIVVITWDWDGGGWFFFSFLFEAIPLLLLVFYGMVGIIKLASCYYHRLICDISS
jgi:hypothetical protein